MVGLILLYFVGKAFYDLAGRNGKGQWLYAILGVASYYAGQFIAALLMAIGYELFLDGSIDDINETLLSFMALPFGVLACWGFYRMLKSRWSKPETFTAPEEILDANLIDQNNDNR